MNAGQCRSKTRQIDPYDRPGRRTATAPSRAVESAPGGSAVVRPVWPDNAVCVAGSVVVGVWALGGDLGIGIAADFRAR